MFAFCSANCGALLSCFLSSTLPVSATTTAISVRSKSHHSHSMMNEDKILNQISVIQKAVDKLTVIPQIIQLGWVLDDEHPDQDTS